MLQKIWKDMIYSISLRNYLKPLKKHLEAMSSLDVFSIILFVFDGRKVPSPCHCFLEADGLQQTLRIFGHNYRPGLIIGSRDLTSLECIRKHVHLSRTCGATGLEARCSYIDKLSLVSRCMQESQNTVISNFHRDMTLSKINIHFLSLFSKSFS